MIKKNSDMVVKSNSLIEASYDLTVNETRIMDMALATLTELPMEDKLQCCVEDAIVIFAENYAKLYDVDKDTAYTNLREASKSLKKRSWKVELPSKAFIGKTEVWEFNWVKAIGYVKGGGVVMLSLTPEITELAGRLKSNFSRYHIEQKAGLSSQYAHRLYEMMMQWRNTQVVPSISYEELRHRFNIGEKEYSTMSNFKRVVLNTAVEQINEHTDIHVSYKQYKEGRKIAGFIFRFKPKKVKKEKASLELKEQVSASTKNNKILKKIPPLTDSQVNTFANKLANFMEFGRDIAPVGKSRAEIVDWLMVELKNTDKVNEWRSYMLMVGYTYPEHIKNNF